MSYLIDTDTHSDLVKTLRIAHTALTEQFNAIPLTTSVTNALKSDKISTQISIIDGLIYKMLAMEPFVLHEDSQFTGSINITLNSLPIEVAGDVMADNLETLIFAYLREHIQKIVSDAIGIGDKVGTWTFKIGNLEPVVVHRYHEDNEGFALVIKNRPMRSSSE